MYSSVYVCECLTMGVTVVGMSDTAEPLLSGGVPDLQRTREDGDIIFSIFLTILPLVPSVCRGSL